MLLIITGYLSYSATTSALADNPSLHLLHCLNNTKNSIWLFQMRDEVSYICLLVHSFLNGVCELYFYEIIQSIFLRLTSHKSYCMSHTESTFYNVYSRIWRLFCRYLLPEYPEFCPQDIHQPWYPFECIYMWFSYWRFDVGVGEAVGVHGSEVSAAYDAHSQARLLRVVLERNHDPSTLLQRLVFSLVDLKGWNEQI